MGEGADVRGGASIERSVLTGEDVGRRVDAVIGATIATSPSAAAVGLGPVAARGKRLRAGIAAAWAGVTPPDDGERLASGAAAIELVHLATLVHDDIIDESPLRRGRPAAWAEHGVGRAIVAGDAVLTRAFGVAAHVGVEFVERLALAVDAVCTGQAQELDDVGDVERTIDRIEAVAAMKTGSLFALAAWLGSHVGRLDVDPTPWGTAYGIAFQLIDDLEDVHPSTDDPCEDLRAGLLTEPWIFAALRPPLGRLPEEQIDAHVVALRELWGSAGPALALERIHGLLEVARRHDGASPALDALVGSIWQRAAALVAEGTGTEASP